jgi:nitrous oxidase accessory protein NosD
MRKLIALAIAALALAAPAAAAKAPLVVGMKDPGCHWFLVGGKYTKSVVRHGPVTLLNRDEATLRIKGPGGTRLERVGAKLTLHAKGRYHITMVRQAPDDNHLTLTVK